MSDNNYQTVRYVVDRRGVGRVTLTRAEKHNALNHQLINELTEACGCAGENPQVRVVVLTGEGESFCAGGDINWFASNLEMSRSQRLAEGALLARMLHTINYLPKPVIGRINGPAYGGGIGLLSVCDVTVGVTGSRFGLTEVRLGFIPATISPHVVRRMGTRNARRTFLGGALFTAEKAREYGLLDEVVAPDELDAAVEQEVSAHLEAAPRAVAETKALIDYVSTHRVDENLDYTAEKLANTWEAEEGRLGITCFLDKQLPPWRS
jgi:methylglutaconyl-CoA hydratase